MQRGTHSLTGRRKLNLAVRWGGSRSTTYHWLFKSGRTGKEEEQGATCKEALLMAKFRTREVKFS